MENSYWTIINLLVSCVENSKVDADELKKARFLLSTELDKRLVCNLPTDETKRQELYTFVLTRLHEDAVYIPLTYECNKAIYRSDLQGFHFTQTQYEVPFADFYFE